MWPYRRAAREAATPTPQPTRSENGPPPRPMSASSTTRLHWRYVPQCMPCPRVSCVQLGSVLTASSGQTFKLMFGSIFDTIFIILPSSTFHRK